MKIQGWKICLNNKWWKNVKRNEVETAELVDDKAGDAASILLRFHQVEKNLKWHKW